MRSERNLSLDLANQIATASVTLAGKVIQMRPRLSIAPPVYAPFSVPTMPGRIRWKPVAPRRFYLSVGKEYDAGDDENAQKNPGAANLVHVPGFLLLGGGVPIKAGNEVIGAVGVGGAPGGHLDEQCAMAALDKVSFHRRKPRPC